MSRYFWCLWACCLAVVGVCDPVEIIDLDDPLHTQYDLTWEMTVKGTPSSPLTVEVDNARGGGYRLSIERNRAVWRHTASRAAFPPVETPFTLEAGKRYLFTLKRRPDTVALLCNHRLLFSAPAPSDAQGSLAFRDVPAALVIDEARYQEIGPIRFGDDFMRPEGQRAPRGVREWIEDSTWKVAFFRKDHPGAQPDDSPMAGLQLNPWQLSFYASEYSSTNGFWFLYRGVGPSWVVADPLLVYPSRDRYFVETAVKTEFDATVGIIAAYQDNRNYLLFRWKQREYLPTNAPKAELVAVVDGAERVLGTHPRGFDPGQWYTLRINLGWQRVQALVDGAVLIDAANPGSAQGRIGLYADGAEKPRKLQLDRATATMYLTVDEKTGKVINDADDAMRAGSYVYFDDVRMGDWDAAVDLVADPSYLRSGAGNWQVNNGIAHARTQGKVISGPTNWERYVAATRIQLPANGSGGLFVKLDREDTGLLWVVSTNEQRIVPVTRGKWEREIARASTGVAAGQWADLRVEADGPYLAFFCNGQRVLDAYDPARAAGRCGLYAGGAGVKFQPLAVTPLERKHWKIVVHEGFDEDSWLITWASPESSWYPAFTPPAYITPGKPPKGARPHQLIGAAAPLPTETPGLYWNKGGYYHDLHITMPVSADTLDSQILHLATNYQAERGYRLILGQRDGKGLATLKRDDAVVQEQSFTVVPTSRLVFERRGNFLLLSAEVMDPADDAADDEVLSREQVFVFRDAAPLRAEMVGFTVTSPALPAAAIIVESDRIQDTFEEAPTSWITQSGVWAVMARYACQPKWNWFGGFGAGTPTVWSKYRLDGDQTVEVFMGIKMQFDNVEEEYNRRYRDMNVTICSDGKHLNSGYTVIRAGRAGTRPVTMLLRNGVIIQTSAEAAHLLPPGQTAHRQWPAMRLEKRGAELKVFLDNRLAMTYVDPDPLPGGYTGFWTLNNGIMLGRVNLSAERMTPGTPTAQAPAVIQQKLDPLPVPRVTLNGTPLTIASFETGLDGWKERTGITGHLVRERGDAANPGTYLKVVNALPAGDLSVSAPTANLQQTPVLHFDYCFDPDAQANLYVLVGETWYEFLLTGKEARHAAVYTAQRLTAVADGQWRNLRVDLRQALAEAIRKRTGSEPGEIILKEIVFADWSAPEELRPYGFCANAAGVAIRFDNYFFAPRLEKAATIAWADAETRFTGWKTLLSAQPFAPPGTETKDAAITVQPARGLRYLHLQGQVAEGAWGGILHLPLVFE